MDLFEFNDLGGKLLEIEFHDRTSLRLTPAPKGVPLRSRGRLFPVSVYSKLILSIDKNLFLAAVPSARG